ncbi:UDP-N-acetylmuramate dehydrogenase [Castellaniella sp.]|uniref:UDP-N-acetylmuramate dehydrogenase n=1 Tax=Castellaniella sp. TaxID=1955812 RepID=UPI002B00352E|nr:UDP-N-acetylmuramate dehydrogenase [Castellaniella sp.]
MSAQPLVFSDQDLQARNTLGLPARAAVAVLDDESAIPALCEALAAGRNGPKGREADAPLFVLGGGSNLVMSVRPHHRILRVALRGIRLWDETAGHWIVEAAAGESWHGFVDHCLSLGWPGLENLALIPGTVGAAPVQNIGAYGLELDQRLHSVVAWDLRAGREYELRPEACGFAYRDSLFKRDGAGRWLIVRVRFALPKAWTPRLDYPDLRDHPGLRDEGGAFGAGGAAREASRTPSPRQVFDAVCDIRHRKLPDPAVLGNAGSFFKNPVIDADQAAELRQRFRDLRAYPQADGRIKLAAGWLIEQAGWKGRRLGPVGMHERQALVLVNHGGAQAADVLALAQAVRADVQKRFGVDLEQEPVVLD